MGPRRSPPSARSPPERSRAARRRPRHLEAGAQIARRGEGIGLADAESTPVLAAHGRLALGFERETRRDGRVVAVLRARASTTANGLREGTGSPVASKKRLSSSSSVADERRSTPSSATFVSVSRWTTFTRDHGTRFAHVFSSDSSSGVAVETTTCELRVAFASCVPSSVSRASRASHAASDAADAASVAALACAFHPAVSTPRVCSTASVRHLSARAAFASAEYRPRRAGSAALGASGIAHVPVREAPVEKHGSFRDFERGVPRVPRGARSGRRRARTGRLGRLVARREARAGVARGG